MLFRCVVTSLIAISSLIEITVGYSHGAPSKSCNTLYPGHGVDKQYGAAPYEVIASHGPAGNIIVTITSTALPFAGFMLQSRLVSDRETIVNGRFSEDKSSQTRNCNGDNPNTLTHRNGASKYKIESSWTPPKGFIGGVVFRATIVQSKNVFWTALDSQPVQIATPVEPKPSVSYNRQQTSATERPSIDNIQSSSVPQSQSSHPNTRINYEICEKKFCFGLPMDCIEHKSCNMLLSGGYVPRGDGMVEFEVYADVNKFNGNSYYSVGLSTDNKMGDDSVTDCLVTDGRPQLKNSVNVGQSNEYLASNEYHGVVALNTSYSNGILYCKWRRRRRSTVRGNQYDLKDKKYHILLAFGQLDSNGEKEYHSERQASDQSVDIRLIGFVSAHSKLFLVKLHGSFMVVAWLGCISVGIFMARYFKKFWSDQTFYGVQIWFAVHRSLMLSALIITLVSGVSIWIYVGTITLGSHQLFGLLSILIVVGNPIGSIFRPSPESAKRWIFNWAHFLMGNMGHISAITALFLAYDLSAIHLSPIYLWILIFYLIFYIMSHLIMQIYLCACRRTSKTVDITMRDMNEKTNLKIMSDVTKNTFIHFYLFFYIVVIVILIIGLVICVYIPHQNNSYKVNK